MTKFKSGDVVKCVKFHGISNIMDDVTYEVIACTRSYVTLNIGDLYNGRSYGEPNTFSVDRFELAEGVATHIKSLPSFSSTYEDDETEILYDTPEHEETKEQLYNAVQAFIVKHRISCPETISQCDNVIIDAYNFIEEICDIVGYVNE